MMVIKRHYVIHTMIVMNYLNDEDEREISTIVLGENL